MKFPYPLFLIFALFTLGCSQSSEEEQQSKNHTSETAAESEGADAVNVAREKDSAMENDSAEDNCAEEDAWSESDETLGEDIAAHSPLCAPEDASIALPYFSPRPLPSVFALWKAVLMSQSEPEKLLFLDEQEAMTEDQQREFEEARGHVLEALDAAQTLYLAQMALVRAPLAHPGFCSMEPDEIEECLSICEAYLAESFHRDLEALAASVSFLNRGCVEPTARPGRKTVLHRSELDSLLWRRAEKGSVWETESGQFSLNDDWRKRQMRFMEHYLALYESSDQVHGRESCDPFTGMHGLDGTVLPASAPEEDSPSKTVDYRTAMRELIRREHRAWERYFAAMGELVAPCSGYRGSASALFTIEYESYLLDNRERFLYMLAAGAENIYNLPNRARETAAELQEVHTKYSFGEIFTDTAVIFRHPKLAGKPWCIRFPDEGAGFILLKDSEVLQQFTTAHPEGGETEVCGYQMIESVGEPYETNKPQDSDYQNIPATKPYGALELRQVFHLLSLPSDLGFCKAKVRAGKQGKAKAGTLCFQGFPPYFTDREGFEASNFDS